MAQREAVFPSIDGRHIEGGTFGDSGCRPSRYPYPVPALSGCPICNTHIAAPRRGKAQLDALGIHKVLFFHSLSEDVATFHDDLTFDAVGEKHYYRQFGVESSWRVFSPVVIRAASASILRGNFGLKITGGPLGLTAKFLVTADGRIKSAHYGKHAYDQWPVENNPGPRGRFETIDIGRS